MSTAEAIMQKVNALPREKQEEVLRFAQLLAQSPVAKTGEPYGSLRRAASLNLEGPSDWSKRSHEYLYGTNARNDK